MKYVQFQVKKRLSHEVPKVTVELSSSVGLSTTVVFNQAQRTTGAKLKYTYSH